MCLVEHTATDRVFALKKMSKPHIVFKRQVDHVNNERRLLAACDHPFVVGLFGSFQDADYLYLLMELIQGGEVRVPYMSTHAACGARAAPLASVHRHHSRAH